MTTKINGSWESINQYIERNTVTGECRLIGTTDIIPNLRYDKDNVGRNYAVTSFKEKRSTDTTTNTIATTYTPVRKVMIMLDDMLVEWDGKEYWKPIEWNDYYQVSTWGNIRNSKGNYLSPCDNGRGYMIVQLRGSKSKKARVNRLVAEAFLPNPNNLSDVDHIAPNSKKNNMVDNLQWLSHADNVRKDLCKPVQLLDYDTEEVLKEFDSLTDAGNYLLSIGRSKSFQAGIAGISNCLRGRYNSAYGFKWRYKD